MASEHSSEGAAPARASKSVSSSSQPATATPRQAPTRRRILFVDDDLSELERIDQMLQDKPAEWEVVFARHGNDALVELANEPCDVVFADMHMPDMSGTELLQEVRHCYPKAVRFLMAEAGNTDFIRRCGGDMHQLLAKPCDAFTVKAALYSALSLDTWLTNENIKAQGTKMRAFRSLPSLYIEVMKALQSPNASADHIGEIIAKDLAMTTKLLQTVNSAFFALRRRITDPAEAVLILGTETVKSLVMSIQTYAELDKVKPLYFSIDKLWRHNMAVATGAKHLTQLATGDDKMADEAFTAGMFHDIGKLVLASTLSDSYHGAQSLALKRNIPLWEVEQEIFGATHAETGAYLIGLWGLPISILEAIALHHAPSRSVNPAFSPLTAVHLANVFNHENEPDSEGLSAPQIDSPYIEALGLTDQLDTWREALLAQTSDKPGAKEPTKAAAKTAASLSPPLSEKKETLPDAPQRTNKAGNRILASMLAPFSRLGQSDPSEQELVHWLVALAAAVLLLAGAGLWLHTQSQPKPTPVSARTETLPEPPMKTPPPLPQKMPAPVVQSTAPRSQTPVPVTQPKPELPSLKLQGIYYRRTNPSAIIDGRTVYRGNVIEGGRVIAIDQQSVTLDFKGERMVLSVKR